MSHAEVVEEGLSNCLDLKMMAVKIAMTRIRGQIERAKFGVGGDEDSWVDCIEIFVSACLHPRTRRQSSDFSGRRLDGFICMRGRGWVTSPSGSPRRWGSCSDIP